MRIRALQEGLPLVTPIAQPRFHPSFGALALLGIGLASCMAGNRVTPKTTPVAPVEQNAGRQKPDVAVQRLDAYRVSGTSMSPALRPGDALIVDLQAFQYSTPERGDIVAIRLATRPRLLVKRVIALAGDTLSFETPKPLLNGRAIEEAYLTMPRRWVRHNLSILRIQLSRSDWIVPRNHAVVLGDNATSHEDSSLFGLVALSQIAGKVVAVKDRAGRFIQRHGLPATPPDLKQDSHRDSASSSES